MTGNGTPYCYSLVFTENLTIADPGHFYADKLSHEIAEMIVDPKGDDSNPEVCDPCAGNCNNIWFTLFDNNGVYMGGTTDPATAQVTSSSSTRSSPGPCREFGSCIA